MARLDDLLEKYSRQVCLPWERKLAGPQRVWFVVYDKNDERRLRYRIGDFEVRARQAGHGWVLHDLGDAAAAWLAGVKYRDRYFEKPELLPSALGSFREAAAARVRHVLTSPTVDENTVTALLGVAGLFGFLRVSDLIQDVEAEVHGRLVVFFPGEYENNNYRLLDARDGWNYLAIPITS